MVQAIPEGRGGIITHLVVESGSKALEFYEKAFDAKILSTVPIPDGRLVHAEFEIAGSVMYLCDDFSDTMEFGDNWFRSPQKLNGVAATPCMYVEDVDAAVAKAEAAGAVVMMPCEDMFWGDRFAQVKDPFGHMWSLSTHIKDPTEEELATAHEEFNKQLGSSE